MKIQMLLRHITDRTGGGNQIFMLRTVVDRFTLRQPKRFLQNVRILVLTYPLNAKKENAALMGQALFRRKKKEEEKQGYLVPLIDTAVVQRLKVKETTRGFCLDSSKALGSNLVSVPCMQLLFYTLTDGIGNSR